MITNFIVMKPSDANKGSALIGFKTREVYTYDLTKFLPYISYGEYFIVFVVHVANTNHR